VADVESTTEEKGKLKQVVDSLTVETKKLKQERDAGVRRHRQAQEELGPLKMELLVAVADLKEARTNQDMQQREIDRLMGELKKEVVFGSGQFEEDCGEIPRADECCNLGCDGYGIAGMVRTRGGITGIASRQGQPGVEYGHLMVVFTLSICGRAILVICLISSCPSLGV
jgi:hypothetical protein